MSPCRRECVYDYVWVRVMLRRWRVNISAVPRACLPHLQAAPCPLTSSFECLRAEHYGFKAASQVQLATKPPAVQHGPVQTCRKLGVLHALACPGCLHTYSNSAVGCTAFLEPMLPPWLTTLALDLATLLLGPSMALCAALEARGPLFCKKFYFGILFKNYKCMLTGRPSCCS